MKLLRNVKAAGAVAAFVAVSGLAACSSDAPDTATDPGSDSSADAGSDAGADGEALAAADMCGDQDMKFAHVDGFGGNSWRRITRAELVDELSACPNISVDYTQTDGDLQKYITAINSYSAQGYDAIITYDDFGSQALSALKQAHDAGVVVVPFISDPGGQVGTDYDGYVQYDFDIEGDTMAKWLANDLGIKGNLLFTGGLPGGSPSSVALYTGISETNGELGDPLTMLTKEPLASSWDPAYMQKAAAGALAKYDKIDAIASDYGNADKGTLRAFVSAGRKIPPLATSATDNELGCMWLDLSKTNPDFELLTIDGTTTVVRIAARKALAALGGFPDNEPENFELPVFIDTANGKEPTCDKDLPPDADLSSALSPEDLAAVFE